MIFTPIFNAYKANLINFYPLYHQNKSIGLIRHDLYNQIKQSGLDIIQQNQQLVWQTNDNCQQNSAKLAKATDFLTNLINPNQNELFAVKNDFDAKPIALIKRSALSLFGFCGYGVHLNGLVFKQNQWFVWLARRSKNKPTEPNRLDQIVAGGINHPLTARKTLQKEAFEEAGINEKLIKQAIFRGCISNCYEVKNGIRADIGFCYDLQLDENFHPKNNDEEVSEFILCSFDQVADLLAKGTEFKINSALIMLDCLIRHGYFDEKTALQLKNFLNMRENVLNLHKYLCSQNIKQNAIEILLNKSMFYKKV